MGGRQSLHWDQDEWDERVLAAIRALYRDGRITLDKIVEKVGRPKGSSLRESLERLRRRGLIELEYQGRKTFIVGLKGIARPIVVPLLGQISAGFGLAALHDIDWYAGLPEELVGRGRDPERLFMLKVKGDSMDGDGIFSGDYVVIDQQAKPNNGDIVAALLKEGAGRTELEATIKHLECGNDGRPIRLVAANPAFAPIPYEQVVEPILGTVVVLLRTL
jgi:repressor LexA